jgi:hypothetical protein
LIRRLPHAPVADGPRRPRKTVTVFARNVCRPDRLGASFPPPHDYSELVNLDGSPAKSVCPYLGAIKADKRPPNGVDDELENVALDSTTTIDISTFTPRDSVE